MSNLDSATQGSSRGKFASTRWSLVFAAGGTDSTDARNAMSALCESYWYPLYVFVRREGYDQEMAADLTQGFFTRILEKKSFGDVRPDRGRFRTYLLASMKHFLINEWDRAKTLKRGGGKAVISLDFASAEGRYQHEPVDATTPESEFDRQWALTLLERVQLMLRREFDNKGKLPLFTALQSRIGASDQDQPYRQIAERLNLTVSAVKVAVHRLRRRFREILREEIAQTVARQEDIDSEVEDLFAILRR